MLSWRKLEEIVHFGQVVDHLDHGAKQVELLFIAVSQCTVVRGILALGARLTPRHLCQGWVRVPLNIVQVGDSLADEAQEALSDELLLLFVPFALSDKVINVALK